MTTERFNQKFAAIGGSDILMKMVHDLAPRKEIAKHFNVTPERVGQWIKDITGRDYDPRHARRMQRIEMAMRILGEIGKEKAWKMYRNRYYLRIAAKELNIK